PTRRATALHDIMLSIPRGTRGRVGSGESSLLQGLIGIRTTDTGGKWAFGGSVVYCPQAAWIQNATWVSLVLYAARDSCLLLDLQLLADGDLMETFASACYIADSIRRWTEAVHAVYYNTDVVIFDDPLSAVDAKVGKALFRSAIQGLVAQGKTVLLVTHALHFLTQCDYIYTLDHGRIAKAGTYPELI
ncbi:P-loop containing nucleoside triphosphate hydrolase protein, partial [Mycena leptocephala]